MISIYLSGFNSKEFPDVVDYVHQHCHPRWKRAVVERMNDSRGDFFCVLLTDQALVERSREAKIWNLEHDPIGAGRGFMLDPETNRFTNEAGKPLLTTVYTRWAIERRRRRPGDPPNSGRITDDKTWECMIIEIIEEIREAHEGQRFSMHEPVPVEELT